MFDKTTSEFIFAFLEEVACEISQCGSQVTCDPPPGDKSDWDYLILTPTNDGIISAIVKVLTEAGFVWEGGEHYQQQIAGSFMSFRLLSEEDVRLRDKARANSEAQTLNDKFSGKGGLNLIITSHRHFADRHRLATYVCKQLNLMNKEHRITVFQAVLYGNKYSDGAVQLPEEKPIQPTGVF